MWRNTQWFVGGSLAVVVVLIIGLSGCQLFDRESASPGVTAPVSVAPPAGALSNCYALDEGDPSGFGVYYGGTQYFMVNIPAGGDYIVQYQVKRGGLYSVVFRAKHRVRLLIGLLDGDELRDVAVAATTITAATGGEEVGNIVRFAHPGNPRPLSLITLLADGTDLFALPEGLKVFVLFKGGKAQEGASIILITIAPVIYPAPTPAPTATPTATPTTPTVPACGGTLSAGYCWYYGGNMESCATVCGTHGGVTLGHINYTGTGGMDANCQVIGTLLGIITPALPWRGQDSTSGGAWGDVGCVMDNNGTGVDGLFYNTNMPTTDTGAVNGGRRICSCVN